MYFYLQVYLKLASNDKELYHKELQVYNEDNKLQVEQITQLNTSACLHEGSSYPLIIHIELEFEYYNLYVRVMIYFS